MNVLFVYTVSNALALPKKPLAHWFEISIAISYLAAIVRNEGHQVSLLVLRHGSIGKLLDQKLAEFTPDLIGFTAVATEFPFVCKVSAALRKRVPEAYQIVGGSHPSLRPEEAIAGPFDAVCVSEGEGPILDLVRCLERGDRPAGIANLWIRNGSEVERNANRAFDGNADALPYPYRAFWEPYVEFAPKHVILLGRGCPFLCTYCANHALRKLADGRYVRLRSQENIIAELKELCREFPDVTYVYFEVETIATDQMWARRFAGLLSNFNSERAVPLEFALNLRVHPNTSFKELLSDLKRAGFSYIRIGIESGSPRVRNEILKRPETNADIERAFSDAREVGLKTYAYNLIGLPGETAEDFMQTVELNRRCSPDRSYIGIFYPYPGTALAELCEERGIHVPAVEDGAERYRARLGLKEFPNQEIESLFRRFPTLIGENQPFFNRMDAYFWSTIRGYPRLDRLAQRLTGHGVLTRLRRVCRSVSAMFPRDS